MQKLDAATFIASPGEQITFSLGPTSHVITAIASVDSGPSAPLPVTVSGDRHVTLTVTFTGNSGGFADINITSSTGGNDLDRIAQPPGIGFRNRIYST
jgi:hypothetical protein